MLVLAPLGADLGPSAVVGLAALTLVALTVFEASRLRNPATARVAEEDPPDGPAANVG